MKLPKYIIFRLKADGLNINIDKLSDDEVQTIEDAAERDKPMRVADKMLIHGDVVHRAAKGFNRWDWWCPNCNYETMSGEFKFCPCCGQKLDWGEAQEDDESKKQ